MKSNRFSAARCAQFLVGAIIVLQYSNQAIGLDIIKIEEHWKLTVGGPDEGRSAPQVSMTMSPTSSVDSDFFSFTINYWSYPDFVAGGLQLQHWEGEDCVNSVERFGHRTLENDGEVVSWVQSLSFQDGKLKMQIKDGNSTSWGGFGQFGYFYLLEETTLENLNDYKPAISIGQSGIGYAGNRVSSLTLEKLRWTMSDGAVHEMIAPIDIDTDLDP